MTHSDNFNPIDATLERTAAAILEPLDLSNEEINQIVEEWCSYDFEIGQNTRCLARLQRVAFEHLMKREGHWEEYRQSFSRRVLPEVYAIEEQE